ncbi:hypothetical protein [Micromonospora sp. NPDC023814]|uniref:hypothetical protein n=1 Tax=Micromonospora sp. NPDC023814 TaxID=3154596 RepID=UPI0033E8A6A0
MATEDARTSRWPSSLGIEIGASLRTAAAVDPCNNVEGWPLVSAWGAAVAVIDEDDLPLVRRRAEALDWAQDYHDVALVDNKGVVVASARINDGATGLSQVLALLAEHGPEGGSCR